MDLTRVENTEHITHLVFKYFVLKRNHLAVKEFSFRQLNYDIYQMRADILAIDKKKREIVIVEVKSCRADFTQDKKYHKYLNMCNKLYFAINGTYIKKEEIPKEIGIIDVSSGVPKVIKNAKSRPCNLDHIHVMEYMISSYAWREALKGN